MSSTKSHKAMGDKEWMGRLRSFASSGVWPSGGGNRPAPRQRKWHDLYQKVKYNKICTYYLLVSLVCHTLDYKYAI